jgi:hypothetical protein
MISFQILPKVPVQQLLHEVPIQGALISDLLVAFPRAPYRPDSPNLIDEER